MKNLCMCCGKLYNPEDDADGSCAEFCSDDCYEEYEDALDEEMQEESYRSDCYDDEDDALWDEDFDDSWLDEDDDDEDD